MATRKYFTLVNLFFFLSRNVDAVQLYRDTNDKYSIVS